MSKRENFCASVALLAVALLFLLVGRLEAAWDELPKYFPPGGRDKEE